MQYNLTHIVADAKFLMTSARLVTRYVYKVALLADVMPIGMKQRFYSKLHYEIITSGLPYKSLYVLTERSKEFNVPTQLK